MRSRLTYFVSALLIGCSNPIRVSHIPHSTSIVIHSSRSQHPVNYFIQRLLYSTACRRDKVQGRRLEDPAEERAELHAEPLPSLVRLNLQFKYILSNLNV